MEAEKFDGVDVGEGEGHPVCLRCLRPVDEVDYYCRHCNEACNQLTQYLPFVNLQWQATIWGRAWRGVWAKDVSVCGRIFRLFMVVWGVPVLLVGLLFKKSRKEEEEKN